MENNLVFIYGTLKRGRSNYDLIKRFSTHLGDATTLQPFPMVIKFTFPYLLNHPGQGHRIGGELIVVDDTTLHMIDRLEGVPSNYIRLPIPVADENHRFVMAWAYFGANSNFDPKTDKLHEEF